MAADFLNKIDNFFCNRRILIEKFCCNAVKSIFISIFFQLFIHEDERKIFTLLVEQKGYQFRIHQLHALNQFFCQGGFADTALTGEQDGFMIQQPR